MSPIVRHTAVPPLRSALFIALFLPLSVSPLLAQFTEYTTGIIGAAGVTAGPDGAMWFSGNGKIARITMAGVVTVFPIPTPNDVSASITAGPDGALWFTEYNLNSGTSFAKIGRVTTSGAFTEYPLPNPDSIPFAIAPGSDGALWFIELGATNIGRITTAGAITEYPLPQSAVTYGLLGMAPGPDGAMWLTEYYGGDNIARMTMDGVFTNTYTVLKNVNSGSSGIALGPDGALWFADQNAKIGRITTSGAITLFPLSSATDAPFGIAAGPDGALWYTNYLGQIGRITTSGTVTQETATPTSTVNYPGAIAAGPDGAMWFTESGGKVGRILTAAAGPPSITLVANAEGEVPIIAPNTWVEIKGLDLAPAGDSRAWQGSDFVNGQLPTQLDGVSVTVNGKPAYVYYISPAQVNILTPPDSLSGSVSVQVTNNGVKTSAFTVAAQAGSPSFFVFSGGPYIAAEHADGSFIGPPSLYPGYTTPVQPNEEIMIFANGFGPTSVPVVGGAETQSGTLSPLPVISIGGVNATVAFAGLIGPGEFQFNVVVPASLSSGDKSITATYNGLTTQPGAMLTVQ